MRHLSLSLALAFAVAVLAIPRTARAEPITEVRKCTGVIDGDTIIVEEAGTATWRHVRLRGVNAPEMGQDWSYHAYAVTRDLCLGKSVALTFADDAHRTDGNGRWLAYVDVVERIEPEAKESAAQGKKDDAEVIIGILGAVLGSQKQDQAAKEGEPAPEPEWRAVADVAAEVLRRGYGVASAYPDSLDRYDAYHAAEAEAVQNRRGIWTVGAP